MNISGKHSITSELKKRVPMFLAILLLVTVAALNLFVPKPVTEPDSVHPFANAKIDWQQSFHAGSWSGAE